MKKLFGGVAALLLFSLFICCEIGLGSAVDTDAPKLSITSPQVDSVIRDTFALSGTWEDDGSIESINAVLERTDGNGTSTKIEGTTTVTEILENRTGTWQVIVDYKEQNLVDGTYQATVTIKDKGRHETTQNITFTIDNTAPVLILTKPNSKPTDDTLSVYGQRLFIEGSIADTTKDTFVEVSFYEDAECTIPLNTIKTQAIAPTDVNSNNGKLATFLDVDYDKIYKTENLDVDDPARKHGPQPVYTKYKIYDSAVRIPLEGEQSAADLTGNCTEYFYVSKDLSDDITLSKTSGGYGLAPIDLYSILNGSDIFKSAARSAAETSAILATLEAKKITTSKFSINPDNSPYFTVSGLKTLTKSGHDFDEAANGYYVKNGTITLEVSVFMGSDSIDLVDDDDFYVYLQECDDSGNAIAGKPEIKLYSKYKEEQPQGQLKKTYYKIGGKEGHKTTTGAYVFSIPMNKTVKFDPDAGDAGIAILEGLNYGSNYVLLVKGKDAEGNPVVPYDNGYGFKFSSSGNGPVLTIDSPSFITTNTTNLSADAIKAPLKVELLIDTTENSLEIKRGEADSSDPSWDNTDPILDENEMPQGPIPVSPPATVTAYDYYPVPSTVQDGHTYKLMYFVYDGVNEEAATKKITYTIDNTPPVIGDITIEGSAYDENKWHQKNTLALVVNVTDSGSKVYKVEYKTDELTDWTSLTKDGENFKGTITFLENGSRTLVLRATDNVGNISTETTKTINIDTGKPDLEGYFYKINGGDINELDSIVYVNPSKIITLYGKYGNKNSGVKELEASIKSGENAPKTPTGWSVKYSTTEITKDAITAELNTISTDAKNYDDITDKTSIKSWVATFTPEAGKFRISGENNMQDANGLLAKTEKELFDIIADTEPPTFENKDLSNSYKSKTKEIYYVNNKNSNGSSKVFKFSGVAKDDFGLSSVSLTIGSGDALVQKSAAWSFENLTFDNADGESISCSLTAVDKAGNESLPYNFTIVIDQSAPSAKHEFDGKEKDLYVRIGDDDNDDISPTDLHGLIWNEYTPEGEEKIEGIDKKVGKKYSNGSYGNDVTIQIRGDFDDAGGSGVSMIYYKVYPTEADILNDISVVGEITQLTDANLTTLTGKVIEKPTGKFAPLEKNVKQRVFYNVKVTKGTDNKTNIVNTEKAKGGIWFSDPVWKITDPAAEGYLTQTGYYKFWKIIETSFNTTIAGLAEGNNYIVFVAEDNLGNAQVDYAIIPRPTQSNPDATAKYPCYSLNIDTKVPVITTAHDDDIIYTNRKGTIKLTGTVNDEHAGIDSLEFYIGSTLLNSKNGDITFSFTDTGTGDDEGLNRYNSWTAIIKADKFPDNTTSTVYMLAKDKAGKGNTTKNGVATVKIDKRGPNVLINSPAKDSFVNKTITLKGSVDDGNGAGVDITPEKAPRLFWTTNATEAATEPNPDALAENASSGWVELIVADDKKSWDTTTLEGSFNIDTTTLKIDDTNGVQDGTTAYFTVSAYDVSGTGNIGFADAYSLKIDQNSDRPVIKFTNVQLTNNMSAESPVWMTKQEIWGSVTDDDGEIKGVDISFDAGNNWESCYTQQEGLNYSFEMDGSKDGFQTIYFRVKDATFDESKNNYFISSISTAADINAPKLAYQNIEYGNTAGKYSTVLYANVDLVVPEIPVAYYTTADDDTVPISRSDMTTLLKKVDQGSLTDELTDEAKQIWKDLSGVKTAVGGTTKYIYIYVKAKDANGVTSIVSNIVSKFGEITPERVYDDIDTSSMEQKDKGRLALFKIDIQNLSGTNDYKLDITATDRASDTHKTTRSFDMTIDKEAPSVNIDSPSADAELYGTAGVAQNNVTVRGRTSDSSGVSKVYLAVTKDETTEPASSGPSAYKDITKKSALSWTVVFNGAQNTSEDVYYTDLFNTYVDALYGPDTTTNETQKDICLWLYAEDKLGNSGKENPQKLPLKILTQGDKPTVAVTYPVQASKVGGVITITGSTSIAIREVEKIYVQIDPKYVQGSSFSNNWETNLNEFINGKTPEALGYEVVNSGNTTIGRGIVAGGSKQSWNVVINTCSEFNVGHNIDIAVRVWAISSTGKVSEPVETWFTFDPDSPTFGNNEPIALVQYENNTAGSGDITASKLYTPGIWIQGKWWLTGSVEDDSGIDNVKLNDNPIDASYLTAPEAAYNGYKLKIPVGVENSVVLNGPVLNLLAQENGQNKKTSALKIELCYDNTPPEFECTSLKTDGSNTIVQSDGVYEIKGTLKEIGEQQSGFKRIAFYVTRNLNSKDYITDIMQPHGSGIENCYELKANPQAGDLYPDEEMYWKRVSGCTAKNGNEIEVPSASVPDFARAGSLCRINDVIYRIESVGAKDANNNKKITIDSKIDSGTINIDFALAQVIDNKVSEIGLTTWYGDASHVITNDDDDEMVESYRETSSEWTVSINSKNIKDGTIQIHFVAYDQAGNKTVRAYNGSVANNAPRIAGVQFGSDINGNGKVDDSELRTGYSGIYSTNGLHPKANITVNGQAANGTKISKLAIPNNGTDITQIDDTLNSVITVKGAIQIIPEVVGGNNGLSWTYSVNGTNKSSSANTLNNVHSGDDSIPVQVDRPTAISIDTLTLLKDISSDGNTVLGFTIWDHTEGTTPGTDSNKAELYLKVNVELRDETPPTAGIKPFYWDSIPIGDNNNSSIVYDNNGIPFGHIELEKDLPTEDFDYDGTNGQEFDLDPKVSGVIYLEGFAKDNVAVEKLYLKFPGLSGFENFGLVAHRDRGNDPGTKGNIISEPNFADNGIELVSATEELVIEGDKEYNLVHWKIKIDTSRIATCTATNVLVQIKAKDRGKATLNASGTDYNYQNEKESPVPESFDYSVDQTGYNSNNQTPSYRIDVVPYISKVYTSLAVLKKNNWSVYNRTALGHYPVADNDTIYLYGFNLGKAGYAPVYGTQTLALPAEGSVKNVAYPSGPKSDTNPESEYAAYKVVTFPVSNVTTSGAITLKVNGVETLNNKNNNEGRGSYTGSVNLTINPTGDKNDYTKYYYNRQPNGDNNNLLTDDVELDVWKINPEAVKPVNGYATQPVMAINPVTHDVGFAFVNGTLYYSMPNGNKNTDTHSYDVYIGGYDFWTSVGLAYDSLGYSYGTAAGGDIADNRADTFRIMTSRWGYADRHVNGYNNGKNQYRLEYIAQADYDSSGNMTRNFNKERIRSPSIATTNATTASTKVYLAYYDEINDEIRFKHGSISNTRKTNWYKDRDSDEQKATFFGDYYGEPAADGDKNINNITIFDDGTMENKALLNDSKSYSESNGKNTLENRNGWYRLEHNSLIAGHNTTKYRKTATGKLQFKAGSTTETERVFTTSDLETLNTAVTTESGSSVYAGKYVSIAAIENGGIDDDAIIAVWWDAENTQLLYSYNKKPGSINAGEFSQADTEWSTPVPIFGEGNGIGEYCKVTVDKNDGIHIAAYDGLNGDLWYAYIQQFDITNAVKKCIVDSYGIIGTELNIDVGLDEDNNPVPYISYYAGSCAKPKIAHWAGIDAISSATQISSAIEEAFTGVWEVSVVPTVSKVNVDHINVGLWKDSDGKITYSTKDGNEPNGSNVGTTELLHNESFYDSGAKSNGYKSWGNVYGNGSATAILGYAVTKGSNGYIETAQMK